MCSACVGVLMGVSVRFLFSMLLIVSALRSPIIHGSLYREVVLMRFSHAGVVISFPSCLFGMYAPMMVIRSRVPSISNSAAIMRLRRCVLCLISCSLSLSHIIDTPPAICLSLFFFLPSVPMMLNPS